MIEFAAAEALKKLIDLPGILKKSRDTRKHDLFEKVVEPFNEKFVEVHDAYEKLFLTPGSSIEDFPMPSRLMRFGTRSAMHGTKRNSSECVIS